jgi:predicted RNase H-like nuclease
MSISILPGSEDRRRNKRGLLYGIDGCRGGWVVASAPSASGKVTVEIAPEFRCILARVAVDSIFAIDIPIGIPENEPRTCDRDARRLLGWPRSSSVFSPPCRKALAARTFEEALQLNRREMGIGISKQAFHIRRKLREVDQVMTVQAQQCVREVHPEVTFVQLNGGPLMHRKKDARGRAERIELLRRAGLNISDSWLQRERARLGVRWVLLDDLVDALACLVTASDIRNGRSRCLGRVGEKDANGLVMEIVCCLSRGAAKERSHG